MTASTQDQSVCPLCGAQNQCVMTKEGSKDISLCWCSQVSMDLEELKSRLSDIGQSEVDQSCICPKCAQSLI